MMQTSTFPINASFNRGAAKSSETRAIEEHKWYLSERLGRDVGIALAELDYRENVQEESLPRAAPGSTNWFLQLLERLAATHGIRALAQVQYSMRSLPFGR